MDELAPVLIDRDGLARLLAVLVDNGYQPVGPTVRDDAIVLDRLGSIDDLPAGWGVSSGPGRYRLYRRSDAALFGHSAGPGSWKQFLHPAHRSLFTGDRDGRFEPTDSPTPRYAFIGMHACDLAAMGVLDRVLDPPARPNGPYRRTRSRVFVVAANCTEPGEVCFCASMKSGPGASGGYDLALTERIDEHGHRFVVDVGSDEGARVIASVPRQPAPSEVLATARADVASAATRMGRAMPPGDLPALLRDRRADPHWDDVASRCLTCGNCTMVCPTCFCTSTEDVTDLLGAHSERRERWASCFDLDFSYVHGGSVRRSGRSRYRQWLTHKLGTWHDQFGESGCVGCGRCIAWCPVGIDITEEVARLSGSDDNGQAARR